MREPLVDDDAALETSREKYGDVAGATAVAGEVYYPVNAVVGQRRGKHGHGMDTYAFGLYTSRLRVRGGFTVIGTRNFFSHVASRDLRSDPGHALTALWCSVATAVWTATSAHTVAVSQ